jgi:hypothetical protein
VSYELRVKNQELSLPAAGTDWGIKGLFPEFWFLTPPR